MNIWSVPTWFVLIGPAQMLFWLWLPPRTGACSAPHVRQSTERRPAPSPKARWKFTALLSHCRATLTVAPSRSSTASRLEYRYLLALSRRCAPLNFVSYIRQLFGQWMMYIWNSFWSIFSLSSVCLGRREQSHLNLGDTWMCDGSQPSSYTRVRLLGVRAEIQTTEGNDPQNAKCCGDKTTDADIW